MSRRFVATVVSAGLAAGAAFTFSAGAHATPAAGAAAIGDDAVHVSGEFGEYAPWRQAITYDTKLVPAGSQGSVFVVPNPDGGTSVGLVVEGLLPQRGYGAHVHTNPCGKTGEAAGPHTQHVQAPADSAHDPAFVNPRNEVWLDFTTGPSGNAFALSNVDWRVGEQEANSVVIHERHTSTAPGEAGKAGDRVACMTVDF